MLPENTPKYDSETCLVTIPVVEGIRWKANGTEVGPGRLGPLQPGQSVTVEAEVVGRVRIRGDREWSFEGPTEAPENPPE